MRSIRIPLNSPKYPGTFALVDERDAELVSGYRWYVQRSRNTYYAQGYRIDDPGRRITLMHRVILLPLPGFVTDHIDGDGLNNTRANLRMATISENSRNRRARSDSASRFLGVSMDGERWKAQIWVNGHNLRIGGFDTEEDAARAYNDAAREHFGAFARLNDV